MLGIKALEIKMKFHATDEIFMLGTKVKFHATGGISRHGDLVEHGGFSLIFKVVPVSVQFNIHFYGV